ncbi:MAG: T9SS type A sorting domain-containing protein [Flavobacteriales bacterium]|nr:T9SS type A sorting domain-containing protein [Flavobacteriales bacterium]
MKKVFSILLLAAVSSPMHSQSFTISENPVNVEVNLTSQTNQNEVWGETMITNSTTESLNLKWERIENELPNCWLTSVFGVWIQYTPQISQQEFELAPGESGMLAITIFTDTEWNTAYGGEASIDLLITNLDDPTETETVEFYFSVIGEAECLLSTPFVERDQITLYPNPTEKLFRLGNTAKASKLVIYDARGKSILKYDVRVNESYRIEELEKGLYLVRLFDVNSEMLTTARLVKR